MPANPNDDGGEADPRAQPTGEVGSEGGSPGDVEIGGDEPPLTGSEAGENVRPAVSGHDTIVLDETGRGRRSP